MAKRKMKNHTTGLAAAFAASALALLVAVSPAVTDTQYAAFTKTTIRRSTTPQTSGTAASMAPARAVAPAAEVQRSSASRQQTAELGFHGGETLAKTTCDCICMHTSLNTYLCPGSYRFDQTFGQTCPASTVYAVEASPETTCSELDGTSCYGTHPGIEMGMVEYGRLQSCYKVVRRNSYYRDSL